MKFLGGIARLLRRAIPKDHRPLETTEVADLPVHLDPTAIYLVGEDTETWFVAMQCPCGCNATLFMSAVEGQPRWNIQRHWNGTVSLSPSVWRKVGCRSHFRLRRGRVTWCDQARRGG